MKHTNARRFAGAVAVGLAAVVGGTSANAQITYQIGGTQNLEGGFNLVIDTHTDNNALVGGIILTPVGGGASIVSVCTDVEGTVYIGSQYNYTPKTFAQAPTSGLDPVWGYGNATANPLSLTPTQIANAHTAIENAAFLYASHSSVLGTADKTGQAALQLAVWAALYNTGYGTGNIVVNGTGARFSASAGDAAAITEANTWLAALGGNGGTATSHTQYSGNILLPVDANGNPVVNVQEMLLTPTPVPEPTTVLAGALLLLPLGVSSLRFIGKSRAA